MARPEYMKIHTSITPQEIIDEYDLTAKKDDKGWVYIEINKGMYGLPQAGILANKLLAERLAGDGYFQTAHTPGLWKHTSIPIMFVICVDDFGVQYVGAENSHYFITTLNNPHQKHRCLITGPFTL